MVLVVAGLVIVSASPAAATSDPTASSLVAVPVVSCQVQYGAQTPAPAWMPSSLPVALPARTATRLTFYSDGYITGLAPKGWACSGTEAADGGQSLSVYPAGQRDPLTAQPSANAAAVTVILDYTGHGPGAELVCALFPGTRAASLAQSTGACTSLPHAERVQHPTADVATFVTPPGVKGSGFPSGGHNTSSGVVIFPQLHPEPGSVNVAQLTCTLPSPSKLGVRIDHRGLRRARCPPPAVELSTPRRRAARRAPGRREGPSPGDGRVATLDAEPSRGAPCPR